MEGREGEVPHTDSLTRLYGSHEAVTSEEASRLAGGRTELDHFQVLRSGGPHVVSVSSVARLIVCQRRVHPKSLLSHPSV